MTARFRSSPCHVRISRGLRTLVQDVLSQASGILPRALSVLPQALVILLLLAAVPPPGSAQSGQPEAPPHPLPTTPVPPPIPVTPSPAPPIPQPPPTLQPPPAAPIPAAPVPATAQPQRQPTPAVPLSVSPAQVPPALPEYTISTADRALLSAIRRSLLTMARDVERRRSVAAQNYATPATLTAILRKAYDDIGAADRGRYGRNGQPVNNLQQYSGSATTPPRETTASGAQYFADDLHRLQQQWPQAQRYYTDFAAALKNTEQRYESRVGSTLWLWQYGQNPLQAKNNRGEIVLSSELRRHLLREHRYLSHLKTQWDIWEQRYVTSILPRHLAMYAAALAQQSRAAQLAHSLEYFWDRQLNQYHALYIAAEPVEQQRLADRISAAYQRLGPPHQRFIDCYLEPQQEINTRATYIQRLPAPVPLNLPTHVASALQFIPYDPVYIARGVAGLAPFKPRCALPTPQEQRLLAERLADPDPSTDQPSEPLALPCPECDELRIELRAVEITLLGDYREAATLEDRLADGPDADTLRDRFLRQWRRLREQAGAAYASTTLNRQGLNSAQDVTVSMLYTEWLGDDRELRHYLSTNMPFTLMLAHLGNQNARQRVCQEIRKYRAGRPGFPDNAGGAFSADDFSTPQAIDPWAGAGSCDAASVTQPTPQQSAFDDLVDPETLATPELIAQAQQVRAAETRYHQRGLLEAQLARLQQTIEQLEQERAQFQSQLKQCLQRCRANKQRTNGG